MYQCLVRHTLSILMLLASGAVLANTGDEPDNRIYLGVAVGEPMTGRFEGDWDFDSETPHALYAGWNLDRHWAIEVGYVNLGDTVALNNSVGDFLRVDGHMLDVGVRYRHPLGRRFEVSAGLGMFDFREDGWLSNLILDPPPVGYGPIDNNDRGVYAEIGGRFHFKGLIALRAAYRWYDFDAGNDGSPWLGIEFGF
jgi:hypothetical protein